MVARKRPEGKEWEELVDEWYLSNHEGKIALVRKTGVTYDTMKHWISESGATRKREERVEEVVEEDSLIIQEALRVVPSVELDFVSFDVESSGLEADFGVTLSAVIKPYGRKPMVFRADDYDEWRFNRADDSAIMADITAELACHAIVLVHYGKFDIRWLRAKATRYGLNLLPPMFTVDTFKIAKQNFAVSRRRLEALSEYFELGKKEPVAGNLWVRAALNGDKDALDKVVAHNVQDCILLEKLAAISFPYLRSIPRL